MLGIIVGELSVVKLISPNFPSNCAEKYGRTLPSFLHAFVVKHLREMAYNHLVFSWRTDRNLFLTSSIMANPYDQNHEIWAKLCSNFEVSCFQKNSILVLEPVR